MNSNIISIAVVFIVFNIYLFWSFKLYIWIHISFMYVGELLLWKMIQWHLFLTTWCSVRYFIFIFFNLIEKWNDNAEGLVMHSRVLGTCHSSQNPRLFSFYFSKTVSPLLQLFCKPPLKTLPAHTSPPPWISITDHSLFWMLKP